jgi:hypothetical protein
MIDKELPVPEALYMPKFIFQNRFLLTALEIRILCYLLYYVTFIEPNKDEFNFTNQQLGSIFNLKTKGYISDALEKLNKYKLIEIIQSGNGIHGHLIRIPKTIIEKYDQELLKFKE